MKEKTTSVNNVVHQRCFLFFYYLLLISTQIYLKPKSLTGLEINACSRQAEIALRKFFFDLTGPTGKLKK